MVHCIAKTAEKKRCTNEAMFGEMYCGVHISGKSAIGQKRKLTAKRCDAVKFTRRSPFNHHKYAKGSKARKQVLRACDNHAIAKLIKKDQAKLKTLKRAAPTPSVMSPAAKKARKAVAVVAADMQKIRTDVAAKKVPRITHTKLATDVKKADAAIKAAKVPRRSPRLAAKKA